MRLLYSHDSPLGSQKANVIQVLHMCAAFAELNHDVVLSLPQEKKHDCSTEVAEGIIEKNTDRLCPLSDSPFKSIQIRHGMAWCAPVRAIRQGQLMYNAVAAATRPRASA